ncbi:butyrate kinase [Moorellaceae bacterium AZ2]
MTCKGYKILVLNPGSTSTKIALFEDEREVFRKEIEHPSQELSRFPRVLDQLEFRREAILETLKENHVEVKELSAIAARGGPLPPVSGGAYVVNEKMLEVLRSDKIPEHASSLAALIAYDIASPLGIPAMIYDAVSTDEMEEIARLSGMPEIERPSLSHALNSRAVARMVAEKLGKRYGEVNVIVAHLGGGITVTIHSKGRIIDVVSDDEGPFSPERAGRVPCRILIDLCYSGQYDHQTMRKKLRGQGGLVAYLGTSNAIEIEERISNGDQYAELVYKAMAYQIAKSIGELATVTCGKVDGIALTGGLAHSQLLAKWITERVSFIAPVEVYPGGFEMEALALGCLRVLRGEEEAKDYEGPCIRP